ncbi:MAG: F0F1 ATP synthase subunit B [Flavobacteriales bacterium]
MELVKPEIGLIFWMTISFLIVLFILAKFAWKPILKSIKEREDTIEQSLEDAYKAKQMMANIRVEHEKMLGEARTEREQLLREAGEARKKIISEARTKAKTDADIIIKSARETIQNEKMAAITELRNQVAVLSLEIAEKVLRKELSSEARQKEFINAMIDDMRIN